jgi:hypothetical protein
VRVLRAKLRGILDKHDAFTGINEREQRRQDRRLSSARAARHHERKTAVNEDTQQIGCGVCQGASRHQIVEGEAASRRQS